LRQRLRAVANLSSQSSLVVTTHVFIFLLCSSCRDQSFWSCRHKSGIFSCRPCGCIKPTCWLTLNCKKSQTIPEQVTYSWWLPCRVSKSSRSHFTGTRLWLGLRILVISLPVRLENIY
jgi:hypothetical protein